MSSRSAHRALPATGDGQSSSVPSPSRITNTSSSSEWQCGTEPCFPGATCSQCRPACSERSRVASGAVVIVPLCSSSTSSTLRMLSGLGAGSPCSSCAASRLGVPGIVVTTLDPRPPDPDRARAGQPADLRRVARAEDEVLEAVRAGDEGVLVLVGAVDDAVARTYLVHLLVLPCEPRAGEHEVQLLGRAVRVRRRRQLARRDPDAVDADTARSCRVAEPLPARVHRALRAPVPLHVIPVRDRHRPDAAIAHEPVTRFPR